MFGRKPAQERPDNTVALRPAVGSQAVARKVPFQGLKASRPQGLKGSDGDGVVFVGKGTQVTGEFNNCTLVEIHGQLEGTVSANTMAVREGGVFKGDFRTDHAEVEGQLDGRLTVHGLLNVRATGRISGEVTYERLVVADGALIGGNLQSATIDAEVAKDNPEQNGVAVNGYASAWESEIKVQ